MKYWDILNKVVVEVCTLVREDSVTVVRLVIKIILCTSNINKIVVELVSYTLFP